MALVADYQVEQLLPRTKMEDKEQQFQSDAERLPRWWNALARSS